MVAKVVDQLKTMMRLRPAAASSLNDEEAIVIEELRPQSKWNSLLTFRRSLNGKKDKEGNVKLSKWPLTATLRIRTFKLRTILHYKCHTITLLVLIFNNLLYVCETKTELRESPQWQWLFWIIFLNDILPNILSNGPYFIHMYSHKLKYALPSFDLVIYTRTCNCIFAFR